MEDLFYHDTADAVQNVCYLKQSISLSDHSFERGARSEVACPVGVRVVTVGEEVVAFDGPLVAGFVQRLDVAGLRRVEHVDARVISVGVLHHFVHVLEPHVAVHVVEVVAHGEHDLIGGVLTGLSFRVLEQVAHLSKGSKTLWLVPVINRPLLRCF